jgi:DNA-binding GntR family transcriptional regulator
MEVGTRDSFGRAYETLRRRLASGAYRPGARLHVEGIVADLRGISATPIREALSRLAGEGLVESRRKEGYSVPLPTASELIDLYRMSELYLSAAVAEARIGRRVLPEAENAEARSASEEDIRVRADLEARRIFHKLLLLPESRLLTVSGLTTVERLCWPRRVEADAQLALAELFEMRAALERDDFKTLKRLIRAYHSSRRAAATRIERALQTLATDGI